MNKKKQDYWHQLIETFSIGMIIINTEGKILYVNAYGAKLLGLSQSTLTGTDFLYPLAADEMHEIEILKPNQDIASIRMTVKPGTWEDQFAWIVSLEDVSQYKINEKRLNIASRGIASAFDGIIITDDKGTILETNEAFLRMAGLTPNEVIGNKPDMLHSGQHNKTFYRTLWQDLLEQGYWHGEITDKGAKNISLPVFLSISAIKNTDGDTTNYIGIFHDLTLIKKQAQQIESMKSYDLLTGLPNQFFLIEKLQHYRQRCSENHKTLIILKINLVVKSENEPLSDLLMLEAVRRIKQAARGRTLLSRIGYKDYVIVYFTQKKLAAMGAAAQKIIDAIASPYQINQKQYALQSIIGLTQCKGTPVYSAEDLLSQAEIAIHQAKQMGFNTYAFFDPNAEQHIQIFHQKIKAIRNAIQSNQLELYYQPKMDMQSERLFGVEALLRWNHPKQGMLMPSQFLTDIDNHPVAIEVGQWVLHQVLQQATQWRDDNIHLSISINISAYALQHPEFIKNLDHVLSKYPQIQPDSLIFEVLETETLEDLVLASKIIKACKSRGILFALDDFGTGYSSLTYLKTLDTQEVKLDQFFIRNCLSNPQDIAILKSTIELCRLIKRRLIAKGVEMMIHARLLFHLGCTLLQGYAIAKPMRGESLIAWLEHWRFNPEWKKYRFSKQEIDTAITLLIEDSDQFEAIAYHLESNTIDLLDINIHACLLEQWLIHHQQQFKDQKTFNTLYDLHQKNHMKRLHIIKYAKAGKKAETGSQLKKLNSLRDMLLNTMMIAILE